MFFGENSENHSRETIKELWMTLYKDNEESDGIGLIQEGESDGLGEDKKQPEDELKKNCEQNHKRFEEIFSKKQLRLLKNNNFNKYLLNFFINKIKPMDKVFFSEHPDILASFNRMITKERKEYSQIKNYNFTIHDKVRVFGLNETSTIPKLKSHLVRKTLGKMLTESMIPSLFENSRIKKIKEHYFNLKIEIYRCRNTELMKRSESK